MRKKLRSLFDFVSDVTKGSRTPLISLRTKKKKENVERVGEEKKELKKPTNKKLSHSPCAPPLEFGTKLAPGRVEMLLPIRTVSEGNSFEAWQKKHKRHKEQHRAVKFAMIPIKEHLRLPCKIKYTRFAPRELDRFENLPMSMKYLNDQVCAELTGDFRPGRADGDKRIESITCDQVKSKEYAVKILIEF